ncbi:MAG: hypothetical protein K2W94_07460 [Alphaproteobacteria bacterium]|nr:hypothetical protein [Alphaproteobacteria bacterium]
MYGHFNTAVLLAVRGADIDATNTEGHTGFQYVHSETDRETLKDPVKRANHIAHVLGVEIIN